MTPRVFNSGVRLLQLWLWSLAFLSIPAKAAEYLPDAATHLGTVVINQDSLYTTNTLVTLTIKAVNQGTGISQMQFSNDGQTWSSPQTYATSKQWTLSVSPQDYPPTMNTVLKTVYVRVKYGGGLWSKAFSDGIIFARSAQDVPIVQDVWVMQSRPVNYDASQPLGSQKNPYVVPAGANQVAFDTLMYSLKTNYFKYRALPLPTETNVPPMTNVAVMNLHLGPGTYQTHGDYGGRKDPQSWSPTSGGRISGAGKDSTILLLVGGTLNPLAAVIGNSAGTGLGAYNNFEIRDLTVDANMQEGGNTTSGWIRNGVYFAGNNVQVRRLRVKGFGSRVYGREPAGMSGSNSGIGNLYNFHIEDCEVVAPQSLNKYNPIMIGYYAAGQDVQSNAYYWANLVIRNNYINGLTYSGAQALNATTNSFFERGSHGIGLGGCTNGIIEDNLVEHVFNGYYNEIYEVHDLLIRNNHYRDIIVGLKVGSAGIEKSLRFEGNLVELDPFYYPGDYGWRTAIGLDESGASPIKQATIVSNTFQFTDRATPASGLGGTVGSAIITGSVDIENNRFLGLTRNRFSWAQPANLPPAFYDKQADIVQSDKAPPLILKNNQRDDGTVVEEYPYVLDKTLPHPVLVPGQTISFPTPLINGSRSTFVTGLPTTNVLTPGGTFTWTPDANTVGKYIVSFYSSPLRTNEPRRTLITVQSALNNQDPDYFKFGLKGFWKFSEGNGVVLRDSTPNSNHIIILTNSLNFLNLGVSGHRSGQRAIQFKNTNPVKTFSLSISNKQIFSGLTPIYQPFYEKTTVLAQPFSVSYWFKADHKPAKAETIFNYGSLAVLGVTSSSDPAANIAEIYTLHIFSPDLQYYQFVYPQHAKFTVGDWHHLVFVYDGVGTQTYVDGSKRVEIPYGQIEDFNPGFGASLGGWWYTENYAGSMSELAIWNRPLSATEVSDLYANQQQSGSFPSIRPVSPPTNVRVQQ